MQTNDMKNSSGPTLPAHVEISPGTRPRLSPNNVIVAAGPALATSSLLLPALKKQILASLVAFLFILTCTSSALANVSVTFANGWTGATSADNAVNGAAPGFVSTLGDIMITESGSAKGDIVSGTLILTAP